MTNNHLNASIIATVLLSMILPTQGGVVQSNTTYTAYADLPVSASDLVNYGQPTLDSYALTATSDSDEAPDRGFITGTAGGAFSKLTWFRDDGALDQLPATITLNLDLSVNSAGYDISEIASYAGYIGGIEQGDQIMTVEYSVVGDAGFTTLGTYSYETPGVDEFGGISLSDDTAPSMMTGVDALRFSYEDPATADLLVLQEIDVLGTATPNGVNLTSYPSSQQFYARDPAQMHVSLPVIGEVETNDIAGLLIRTFANGVQHGVDQAVSYSSLGNTRSFSTTVNLPSLLAKVEVQLVKTKADGSELMLASSADITVGDVYIIQGQSNADANIYVGSANANVSPYILTYGTNSTSGPIIQNSLAWQEATGDGSLHKIAGIGQWGLKMANELVNTHQVPIAIFNGAHPGQSISFFQRDDADIANLNTNYGRLYYRLDQEGMRSKVRGILYYQGESDYGNTAQWLTGWNALYADWKEDYPNTEQYYLVQVREGCGVTRFDIALRDAQRLQQELSPDITALSPLGVDAHDGCHYNFVGGYESLGERFAKLLGRDFYGAIDDPNVETIYPVFAELIGTNKDQIRIAVKRPQASITFQSGAEADFLISGVSVTVVSGAYANGFITLQLSGNATGATDLIYGGRAGAGQWVLSSLGNSLIAFSEPIALYLDSDNDGLSDNEETQITFTNPLLADTDNDGTADKEELALGLDPNDPSSRFSLSITNQGSGSPQSFLTWPSQEGLSFKLYYSQDLVGNVSTWQNMTLVDNDGDQADFFKYDISSFLSSEKYFFVVELLLIE